jgi:hypothetical protein
LTLRQPLHDRSSDPFCMCSVLFNHKIEVYYLRDIELKFKLRDVLRMKNHSHS